MSAAEPCSNFLYVYKAARNGPIARLALAPHDHESALAEGTPHRALEIVVVNPLPASPGTPRLGHLLDAVENLGRDERFLPTGVLPPAVLDQAEVLAVAQQLAERVDRKRDWYSLTPSKTVATRSPIAVSSV
jgi:hypothetical protein